MGHTLSPGQQSFWESRAEVSTCVVGLLGLEGSGWSGVVEGGEVSTCAAGLSGLGGSGEEGRRQDSSKLARVAPIAATTAGTVGCRGSAEGGPDIPPVAVGSCEGNLGCRESEGGESGVPTGAVGAKGRGVTGAFE